MSKLLYVISSLRGEQSESRAIADQFLHSHQRSDPSVEVDVLDLWNEPLPVHGGKGVAAKMAVFAGQTPSGDAGAAWAEVQLLLSASTLPMTISSRCRCGTTASRGCSST
jgi:FMN-dependent NADH-azoreductase